MQHLMIETIARLVDEAPNDEEKAHLDDCEACTQELEAMRADVAALASLPMIEPPPTEWPALEDRLLEEGLIRRRAGVRTPWVPVAIRAAASVAIFALGAMAGIGWTRGSASPGNETVLTAAGLTAELPAGGFVAVREPRNPDEARALYRQAEAVYLDALTRVSDLSTDDGDPFARLATLESIAAITRSALAEAPADPIINGYHLTALAQREATLRQIANTGRGRWF
ncbi:MAG: hypothetical protein L0271_09160 [Gemmatimonadetes bacterium]|nr:hypothetical protein [Gemmatimonadota bacterium]